MSDDDQPAGRTEGRSANRTDVNPGGQLRPCGERALLIECDSLPEAMAVADRLRKAARADSTLVEDVVPAARSVLLTTAASSDLPALRDLAVHALSGQSGEVVAPAGRDVVLPPGRDVVIPVVYCGEDLLAVAEFLGLSSVEVVRLHTTTTWQAAFGGFAPGFCYLVDPQQSWPAIPRHATPRPKVSVGSVALADSYSGIYPNASPGGWRLIGRTSAPIWDAGRDRPALIEPGDRVRFFDVDSQDRLL